MKRRFSIRGAYTGLGKVVSVSPEREDNGIVDFWAGTWIGAVVLILLSCSLFSLLSLLRTGACVGAATALLWTGLRAKRAGRAAFTVPRFHGIGWGLPVLLALCFVSLLAGPHCFLDSYSYRIPQMFFWLQEGHPWSVPNVDMRINQMPHVWPILSAAFFLPLGERALALPNYISLLLLASLFRHWAHRAIHDARKADAAALVFFSAPVFLMGGTTNDNVVTCVTFLALSLHFAERFGSLSSEEGALRRRTLALSAIAFALCCGIKPQYLVLSPIWGLWFFFAPSRPWKSASPRFLAILLPVLLLCSPIPTFAVNQFCWGSYNDPWVVDVVDPQPRPAWKAPKQPVSRSGLALVDSMLSPPLNPAFHQITRFVHCHCHDALFRSGLENWKARPVAIAEHASFGFWTTVPWLFGMALCVLCRRLDSRRNRDECSAKDLFTPWLPLVVFPLLVLAVWMTRAGSLGRSFIGFFVLSIPCAFFGLGIVSRKALAGWTTICLLNGIAIIVLDPARPLWPVESLVRTMAGRSGFAKQLSDYARYSHRQDGPDALLAAIPATESRIGIVVEAGEPIADLWLRREPGTTVMPYPRTLSADRLHADGIRFLIVKDDGLRRHFGTEEWIERFAIQTGLRPIRKTSAVTYIQKGHETWFLFSKGQ